MVSQCIVIGASAGGLEPLKEVVSQLPANLHAPVFVVVHTRPYAPSLLPEILSHVSPLPAVHPRDGTKIEPAVIYIAPPDHHLLIDDGDLAVKRGPKENGFRPSIDALFRSAAYAFGPNVIGVVLSGSLNDGTSGLWSIKRLGGIAMIQEPSQAKFESMPRSVLEYVDVDYRLDSSEIGVLLGRLARERSKRAGKNDGMDDDIKQMAQEVQIAAGIDVPQEKIFEMGELTPFTCPECQGVLTKIVEGKLTRFRCHTGHAYTEDALLEEAMRTAGELLWRATRGFQEIEMLLEHMARHSREVGYPVSAEKFLKKARELEQQARNFQAAAVNHESLSSEKLGEQTRSNPQAPEEEIKPNPIGND